MRAVRPEIRAGNPLNTIRNIKTTAASSTLSLRATYRFYVLRSVHFGTKFYNDQRNAQVFNIYQFTSALHVSGFLLAHLQRQVYNFGSGLSLLGMVSAPGL
jgi:hypothetical protein